MAGATERLGVTELGTAGLSAAAGHRATEDGATESGAAAVDLAASEAAALGLAAARRAVTVHRTPPPLRAPLVVQLVPPSNLAVGSVPWGLGSFVPADSYRQLSTATAAADLPAQVSAVLGEAGGRSLIIVVRDAHRHAVAKQAVELMLAGRPDAIVVEMGLPVWQPAGGSYLTSYGAGRSNAVAIADVLGLIGS